MTTPTHPEPISITRSELLALTAVSCLGGAALSGVIAFALEKFGHVTPSLAYAAAFLSLGLVLYIPLKLRQRGLGENLTFIRFLGAAGTGAIVVGLLTHVLH